MYAEAGIRFLEKRYSEWKLQTPDLHCVLGSGIGSAIKDLSLPGGWKSVGEISFADVPGLTGASAPDHAGVYRYYSHGSGKSLCLQFGRLHGYEGLQAREVVKTVMLPRLAGTSHFILTNAAGSLTTQFEVGSVMVIRDHVNLTGQNPLCGPNPTREDGSKLGERFPDMTRTYDLEINSALSASLKAQQVGTHEGVYLGLLGPSFETPAEISLFARWGLQAVGMSTVWEAIALRHSGASVGGASLISNWGTGLSTELLSHADVVKASARSAPGILKALFMTAEKLVPRKSS